MYIESQTYLTVGSVVAWQRRQGHHKRKRQKSHGWPAMERADPSPPGLVDDCARVPSSI